MRRLAHIVVAAVFVGAATACAPMTVSSHVEHGLDLTRYQTFEWGPADALPTGDPRLDENPFFKDHFEGAVEKQLAARQIVLTTANPDLLIHYHASISRRIEANPADSEYGYCANGNCGARVTDFEAGTLILDIIDAHTNRLIWRGWAQHALEDMLENRDHMAGRIDEAVRRMLDRFRPL